MHTNSTIMPTGCQVQNTDNKYLSAIDGYNLRKVVAERIATAYDNTTSLWQYAAKIRGCGSDLIVATYETGDTEIKHALFCRSRLCPMCAWRRSLQSYGQLSDIMDYLDNERKARNQEPYSYIFATLTLRNCAPEDLPETLDAMDAAYTRMTRKQFWTGAIKGAHRSIEVTYNAKEQTYHPHYHILAAVEPYYFNSRYYISHRKLLDEWRKALKIAYDPFVDIRRVQLSTQSIAPDERTTTSANALSEVSKYVTKEFDLAKLPLDDSTLAITGLHVALHGRKLFRRYGVIRAAQRALHQSDEDGDLINVPESELKANIRKDLYYTVVAMTYTAEQGYIAIEYDKIPEWQKGVFNALSNDAELHNEEVSVSKARAQ